MKNLITFAIFTYLVLSQAWAKEGIECKQNEGMPTYSCLNVMPGADLRITIMEYQTCENGKVIGLQRLEGVTLDEGDETYSAEKIDLSIIYGERSYDDRANRPEDFTFVMPLSLTAKLDNMNVKVNFTNKLQPIKRGSLEKHMPATFIIVNENGSILKKGSLSCGLSR